jgi:serine/threonine-protein kinase RsbW
VPEPTVVETRRIPSDPVLFRGIRDWLAGLARNKGFDEVQALELTVAVNEACANIHRHAYEGRADGSIEFHMEAGEGMLSLRIRDYGGGFLADNPALPDFNDPGEGGYGLFLIRELMDEVEYIRKETGTELRMKKRRNRTPVQQEGDHHAGQD